MIVECLQIWILDSERHYLESLMNVARIRIFNIYVLLMKMQLLSFQSMMGEEEYKNIIQDNIIMELNDDDPSSKLLGVQIDIDLEDKGKSSEDMK